MHIFIEKDALNYEVGKEVFQKFKKAKIIENYEGFFEKRYTRAESISLGKKFLFVLPFKGRFFRKCPGTPNYICCGYRIFHFAEGCPLDCTYCILQCYFNNPGIKLWANLLEEGFTELKKALVLYKKLNKVLRIGTGEFADSLALESFYPVTQKLCYLWKEIDPLAVIEFKTKVALSEEFFKSIPSDPRIIFSWSVNTERIIKTEERGTASLERRFKSALLACEHGFSIAFHFDPIIYYEAAEKEYPEVLNHILKTFPLDQIAWISFGTLRYPHHLKEIAEKRFSHTKIYSWEFVEGLDKKQRYFKKLRERIYSSFAPLFKTYKNRVYFYFCMESEEIWGKFLYPFKDSKDLVNYLDKSALYLCQKGEN